MNTTKTNIKKRKWLRRLLWFFGILFLLLIVFITWFYFITKVHPPEVKETKITNAKCLNVARDMYWCGPGWLRKDTAGIWEMYLEGEPYELGVEHGKLTTELARMQEEAFISQIKLLVPSDWVLHKLKYFIGWFNRDLEDHISLEYKQEIFGVSQYASDKFDFIAPKYMRILNYHAAHDIGHAVQDKNMAVGCTSFVIKKDKSATGNILCGRNFDFYSGDAFAENKIVCFENPSKGFKYAFVTWAGFTGAVSGMNEAGLCVTINAAKSDIPLGAATPVALLVKEILQYAGNIQEAKKIADKRKLFVSEAILITSAADNDAIIIEKSPIKTGYYSMESNSMVAPNHYLSAAFTTDENNIKNIAESASAYRLERAQQLLASAGTMNVTDVAKVLRDRFGKNNDSIGFGNEKCMNQLISHHSIIFDPLNLRFWVSTAPWQLGKYLCYDLNTVFRNKVNRQSGRLPLLDIAADSWLGTMAYHNYVNFRKTRLEIQQGKTFSDLELETFIQWNPKYYLAWETVGDYYLHKKNYKVAIGYYENALRKEIATVTERQGIMDKIELCKKEKK